MSPPPPPPPRSFASPPPPPPPRAAGAAATPPPPPPPREENFATPPPPPPPREDGAVAPTDVSVGIENNNNNNNGFNNNNNGSGSNAENASPNAAPPYPAEPDSGKTALVSGARTGMGRGRKILLLGLVATVLVGAAAAGTLYATGVTKFGLGGSGGSDGEDSASARGVDGGTGAVDDDDEDGGAGGPGSTPAASATPGPGVTPTPSMVPGPNGTVVPGGGNSSTNGSASPLPSPTASPTDVPFAPDETPLPEAVEGQYLVAVSSTETRPNGEPRIVARSYDGFNWEAVPDADFPPVEINCARRTSGRVVCALVNMSRFAIQSRVLPTDVARPDNVVKAARLLSQGAFGAPASEIRRVAATYRGDAGQWVFDQMRTSMTSAREYMRQRVNPRPVPDAQLPQPMTSPCDLQSRWHEYVFETSDIGQDLVVTADAANSRFVLTVNGTVRGTVTRFAGEDYPGATIPFYSTNGNQATYSICDVIEGLGDRVRLLLPDDGSGRDCGTGADRFDEPNPAISFTSSAASSLGSSLQVVSADDAVFSGVTGGHPGSRILTFRSFTCTVVENIGGDAFLRYGSDTYLRFDKRLRWWTNTVDEPSSGGPGAGAGGVCPLVGATYLNRDHCVRRPSCDSAAPAYTAADVTLDQATLRAWYTDSEASRVVYYMTGLRLEAPYDESFCTSRFSRWLKIGDGNCPGTAPPTAFLDESTTGNTIRAAIAASTDANIYVRDVTITSGTCDAADPATVGATVQADGACWRHTHPDNYGVRDATRWVEIHDGNAAAMSGGGSNPITRSAVSGQVVLNFPASHPMMRWKTRSKELPFVGRYGDVIAFTSLQSNLQTTAMALRVGALSSAPAVGDTIACGSPHEVANIPALGDHYFAVQIESPRADSKYAEFSSRRTYQQKYVLNNVMFHADDQLRQRVTWALSNFFVISQVDQSLPYRTESYLSYWDMLAGHAFGNFLDIMRDVSYHPLMAKYLTYDSSRSFASSSRNSFPDENYSRELMQLFSIGLWKMRTNGVHYKDARGESIPTYSNDDIVDFARVWTGLRKRKNRLNSVDRPTRGNFIDPVEIIPSWRDRFPKAKLDKGHIGDGYPLCDELPAQAFLRPGARYEFTGSSSIEGDTLDNAAPEDPAGRRGRFAPATDGSSALYNKLCAPATVGGACTYPLSVTLDTKLPCNGEQECNAHRVAAVAIYDPVADSTKYYRYVERPCVRLTFFDDGKELFRSSTRRQCGNPRTVRGVPSCCDPTDLDKIVTSYGPECLFANEAMNFDQAEARCQAQNLTTCTTPRYSIDWGESCADSAYGWANASCTTQIQVYPGERVSIYDPLSENSMLSKNSYNFFRARWAGNRIPLAKDAKCPADAPCEPIVTGTGHSCLCNFTVAEEVPYSSVSSLTGATVEDIVDKLHVGAADPAHYDAGEYTRCVSPACNTFAADDFVHIWLHSSDSLGRLSRRTIVELPPNRAGGPKRFLLNRVSTVHVGPSYKFRNMPAFIPLLGWVSSSGRSYDDNPNWWIPKVEQETEALLVHLFEHDNTAPFIALHMIRNMVTSNPSPRYIRAVSEAFVTGKTPERAFSGRYGDMGAMVYALLTDREARSPALLGDARAGMVLDPLVKTMSLLRSLEYRSFEGREILFDALAERTGVQVFQSPSVFNFYSPYFQPDGALSDNGLYAPQAELLTSPRVVGMLNGLFSLIDNGVTHCAWGFGTSRKYGGRSCSSSVVKRTADGNLTFVATGTPEAVVDELSLVVAGGRVLPSGATRQVLINEYNRVLGTSGGDSVAAQKHITKILVASPEFQTSTMNTAQGTTRPKKPSRASQQRPIKSIIMVDLKGGADSYNFLVPYQNCGANDLFQQYTETRGLSALSTNQLLAISAAGSNQPCSTFAMHAAMPKLKQLYDDGDLLWFANIGAMVEPLTLAEYKAGGKQTPPFLFAHNFMQRSLQNVHAQSTAPKGVLGRAADTLVSKTTAPFDVRQASFGGANKALDASKVPYDILRAGSSVTTLQQESAILPALKNITQSAASSHIAERYMSDLMDAIESTNLQKEILDSVTLDTPAWANSGLSRQIQTAARLIKARALNGSERVAVYTNRGGWDTHGTVDLDPLIGDVDFSLDKLVTELKAQNRWDSTVVVVASEFGRTMRNNGAGTDHSWGGHAFVLGGGINGGRILGKYPDALGQEGTHTIDKNGRTVPGMPWEGMWKGILEWYGITDAEMETVLPNLKNFPASDIYDQSEMFN